MAEDAEPSFNKRLRSLPKGSSLSIVERYTLNKPAPEPIKDALARMRRNINAQVSRVRDVDAGSNFRVESAVTMTNDNEAMLAVVAVTRL